MKPLKEFEVKRETKGPVQLVTLIGPLDDYTFQQLAPLLPMLQQDSEKKIIIDCDSLDHMSGLAIRSLARFTKEIREAGGEVLLVRVPDKILAIIGVLGHAGDCKILNTVKEALQQLAPDYKEEEKLKF
jgi:anti-anti-sigma factor